MIGEALAAALAGGLLSGVGTGVSAALSSNDAKEAAKGPVRGGTERAGNKGEMSSMMPDASTLEKLGQTALPIQSPVYGNPIDMNQLYNPQKFGSGFTQNYKNTRRFV